MWNGTVGRHWARHHTQYDALLSGVDDALFDAAAIADRDRVLDIGCGAGATTREAGRRTPAGHAVGVDVSVPLLDRARAATEAAGQRNVSYELGDVQQHPFPKAGYDVALSRGGVMFFADHRAAFGNVARALRPGGRLAFVCPQPVGRDSAEAGAMAVFRSLLEKETEEGTGAATGVSAHTAPDTDRARAHTAMAALSDPAVLRRVLADFSSVRVHGVQVVSNWGESPSAAVDFVLSRTPDRTVAPAARRRLARAFEPFATADGVRIPAAVWLVTAVRPH